MHIIYLPEEWLRSNGLIESFPQYIDHQMLLILQRQFLYSKSVELVVEGKKILRINGMANDSNAQVGINISLIKQLKRVTTTY